MEIPKTVGLLINFFVGSILVFAAISKYLSPLFFIRQIEEFYLIGITNKRTFALIAFFIIGIEFLLGISLIINYMLPVTIILAIILFTVFIYFLWTKRKVLDSCGCFGTFIKRTPVQSILENILIIALLVISYFFIPLTSNLDFWKTLAVIITLLISSGFAFLFIYTPGKYPLKNYSILKKGASAKRISFLKKVNWRDQRILIVASGKSCHFCIMQLAFLNNLRALFSGSIYIFFSETDGGENPAWIDKNININSINNYQHFILIAAGKPAAVLIENGKMEKVWNYMLPFPWEFVDKNILQNRLNEYLVKIIKLYSEVFTAEDHKFLITVLFEQAIKLFKEKDFVLTLQIFETITNNVVKDLIIDDVIIAKGFVNLALVYLKQEKLLKACENFERAAEHYGKSGQHDLMIDSFAKSYAIASILNEISLTSKIRIIVLEIQEKHSNENLIEKFNTISSELINDQLVMLKESNLLEAN